jgi:hypothetical protein
MSDFSLLIAAFTFKNLARDFTESLRNDEEQLSQTLEKYANLKRAVDKINRIFGLLFLCCLLEELVYFSLHVGQISVETDWLARGRYTFFMVGFFYTLYLCASATNEMRALEDWIIRGGRYRQVEPSLMILLVSDLNRGRVGVTPVGLFTITYGFIGTV